MHQESVDFFENQEHPSEVSSWEGVILRLVKYLIDKHVQGHGRDYLCQLLELMSFGRGDLVQDGKFF